MDKECIKAKKLLDQSSKILIVSHRKPDADTLGSALALKFNLRQLGDKDIVLACVDAPCVGFDFLPGVDAFVNEFNIEEFDLMVIVDAGASYITDFHLKYENFFKAGIPIINIDHHASNDNFGTINIVDPEAASTTIILYRLFKLWNWQIYKDIATVLLAGICNDTGSFMHSNTNAEVYAVAADLMENGAQIGPISKSLFRSRPVSTLKLWGKVLEKTCLTGDSVVMSVVRDGDYDVTGANPDQLSGVIDYLNMVPDTKFAILVNEDKMGNVKGSLRTRKSDVDLSRIAAVFGGGGHTKASGFIISGKLQEEKHYSIVSGDMSKKSLEF